MTVYITVKIRHVIIIKLSFQHKDIQFKTTEFVLKFVYNNCTKLEVLSASEQASCKIKMRMAEIFYTLEIYYDINNVSNNNKNNILFFQVHKTSKDANLISVIII